MCHNMDMKANECEETGRREDAGERNSLRLWREVAQGVFPFLDEEVGELGGKDLLFVAMPRCGANCANRRENSNSSIMA